MLVDWTSGSIKNRRVARLTCLTVNHQCWRRGSRPMSSRSRCIGNNYESDVLSEVFAWISGVAFLGIRNGDVLSVEVLGGP